jgi:hypothetical protein
MRYPDRLIRRAGGERKPGSPASRHVATTGKDQRLFRIPKPGTGIAIDPADRAAAVDARCRPVFTASGQLSEERAVEVA